MFFARVPQTRGGMESIVLANIRNCKGTDGLHTSALLIVDGLSNCAPDDCNFALMVVRYFVHTMNSSQVE